MNNLIIVLIFLLGVVVGLNIAILIMNIRLKKLTKKLWTERIIKKTQML